MQITIQKPILPLFVQVSSSIDDMRIWFFDISTICPTSSMRRGGLLDILFAEKRPRWTGSGRNEVENDES